MEKRNIEEEYKKELKFLDTIKSEETIGNSKKEHAQALYYQLISGAKENMHIISATLELYDDENIIKAMKKSLEDGIKYKVLIDDAEKINKDNKFLKLCLSGRNCDVRYSTKQLKAHITTRDGTAYRYCDDREKHTAIASFNGKKVVKNAYDKVFTDDVFNNFNSYENINS